MKWKEKNGSNATYEFLTNVFEQAGYQCFAELVRYKNPMKEQSNPSWDHKASASLELPRSLRYPPDWPPEFPCTPQASPELYMLTDEKVENVSGG